jgi:hypothetical protein
MRLAADPPLMTLERYRHRWPRIGESVPLAMTMPIYDLALQNLPAILINGTHRRSDI